MIQLRLISLGAGVQSTTMALMAAHGEISPAPDCAIFADTGWEPKAVYDHLAWLRSGNVLSFPVYIVSAGNIRDDLLARTGAYGRYVSIPAHTRDGEEIGIGRRMCTGHYKIMPIRQKERELLGKSQSDRIPAAAVEKWIGISVDEIIRATPARVKFETNRFPLLEKQMTRADCLAWLKRHGYPIPPKSACIGCPFHRDSTWRDLHDNRPEEWQQAVEVDAAIRQPAKRSGEQFLHRQCKPLNEVDLTTLEDHGQLNLFNNECKGMCGV